MNLAWSNRLMRLYDGDTLLRTWDYSSFEKYTGEAITPSMYFWMASYIRENYTGVPIEEEAVDAYYNLPVVERVRIHAQMLKTLENEKNTLTKKLADVINEIHEEEQWRGGFEEGAEYTGSVLYDHSDEL